MRSTSNEHWTDTTNVDDLEGTNHAGVLQAAVRRSKEAPAASDADAHEIDIAALERCIRAELWV
jgi:hypothetical protein